MKPLWFCTVVDRNYVTRALALYTSLQRHAGAGLSARAGPTSYQLFVLCMDQATWEALDELSLEGVRLVRFEQVADSRLRRAAGDRNVKELSLTCKPVFVRWLFRCHPEIELLSFVDSDLFFFAHPAPLFDEFGMGSVGLTEHRFPARLEPDTSRNCGICNGGWVCFRRDEHGLRCLEDWYERCLEWCYDRVETGKYCDQKYLEDWPNQFGGVVVLQHKGANLAPWNVENYRVRAAGGQVWVDDVPLLFYHFSGLRQVSPWLYQSGLMLPAEGALRKWVYRPYVRALHHWERKVGHDREPDCGFRTSFDGYLDIPQHLWSGRMLWRVPVRLW
jgi:hypothetical protein